MKRLLVGTCLIAGLVSCRGAEHPHKFPELACYHASQCAQMQHDHPDSEVIYYPPTDKPA